MGGKLSADLGILNAADLWAAGGKQLYHYQGKKWLDYKLVVFEQNDNLRKVVKQFYDLTDSSLVDTFLIKVKQYNGFKPDTSLKELADEPEYQNCRTHWPIDHPITCLTVDNSNRLWVGTSSGYPLFYGEIMAVVFYRKRASLRQHSLLRMHPKQKIVWAGTTKGAAKYKAGKWVPLSLGADFPDSVITALEFGTGKKMFFWHS